MRRLGGKLQVLLIDEATDGFGDGFKRGRDLDLIEVWGLHERVHAVAERHKARRDLQRLRQRLDGLKPGDGPLVLDRGDGDTGYIWDSALFDSPKNADPKRTTLFPDPGLDRRCRAAVGLFNSNATLAAGVLSNPKNAVVYEAYVKGLIGSSKTADVPTFTRGYRTGKIAANLVGLNLADQLKATDADRVRYGFTSNVPPKAAELRDRMIVAAKALKLGLTSQVCMKYFSDDPHGIFSSGGVDDGTGTGNGLNSSDIGELFSRLLNAFMDDLMSAPDPFCPGIKLGDNTVIAFVGDTPRTMTLRDNWNDPTVGGQNRTWIMSNGVLKTGFFGGDRKRNPTEGGATNDHLAQGPGEGCLWDFKTGDGILFDTSRGLNAVTGVVNGDGQLMRRQAGEAAMAAVLYAITRGDIRRVNDFYSGPEFPAVQVPVLL